MKTYEQLSNAIMNGSSNNNGSIANNSSTLCRFFFQSGYCRNGDACRYSHNANGLSRQEALKTIPCPYYASGSCRFGDRCELLHEERKTSDEVCGICLENTIEKGRKYGILSCCNHSFCFSCLMEWRTEGSSEVASRRVCPTCRLSSDYVVPSPTMPSTEREKEQILQNYKAHCATKPCKHWEIGKLGSCPFGRDCFYAHKSKKGKDMKRSDKSMQQLYEARQRDRSNMRDRDLEHITEMLLMMGLQRHLARRGVDNEEDDDDSDDDDDDVFLSDVIAALLEDEDLGSMLGPYR